MKIIIFDIDGVVTKSIGTKEQIITRILKSYDLYDIDGVKEIGELHLNRKVMLDRIYELVPFDKESVLEEINKEFDVLESNPTPNKHLVNFIKNNSKNYIFCTNTSMPLSGLNTILDALSIRNYFHEILTTEMGSKKDNIMFVIKKYAISPQEILFVDDNIHNIDDVKDTGIHTLHFTDYDFDMEKFILSI